MITVLVFVPMLHKCATESKSECGPSFLNTVNTNMWRIQLRIFMPLRTKVKESCPSKENLTLSTGDVYCLGCSALPVFFIVRVK
jgi:hypothetical protein